MSYEVWLRAAFIVAAAIWLVGNLIITPRYIRTMSAIRDPRRAPFVASAMWVGLTNLFNVIYWLWLIFWTPTDPTIVRIVVLIIPLDYITGGLAWILFNLYVPRVIQSGEQYAAD